MINQSDETHHENNSSVQTNTATDEDIEQQNIAVMVGSLLYRNAFAATPHTKNLKLTCSFLHTDRQRKWLLRRRWLLKSLSKYALLKLVQALLVIYIAVVSFAPIGSLTFGGSDVSFGGLFDPKTGTIHDQNSVENTRAGVIDIGGPYRAVVADNPFQIFCLAVSRVSAFSMYPCLVLVFVSKMRAFMGWLSTTICQMFIYEDLHELHVYCGWVALINGILHTVGHLARWLQQGNMYLLFNHFSGISGFILVFATLLVCVPMMFLKDRIKYEIRKYMHYFFYVYAVALCFHSPISALPGGGFSPIIFSALIIAYTLDATFVSFFMTEKIETSQFHVLPSGMQLTMKVSDRFHRRGDGGYAYVCFPWVDRGQWHAFSLFENPLNPMERQIFMLTVGDWTEAVHRTLQRDTHRPIWVQGPFPSPYSSAVNHDNIILVASGIGITPALSVIRAHKSTRRTNLIWVTRDASMLEFFLEHAYLDHNG